MNLSMTACSFYFKKRNSRLQDEVYPLNKAFTSQVDKKTSTYKNAIELLLNFFDKHSEFEDDEEDERLFGCNKKPQIGETDRFRYLLGSIESGTYGFASELVDKSSKKKINKITPNQAPVKKFYVFFMIPKDVNRLCVEKGMVFFQNNGQFGIKTVTTDYLKRYLQNDFNISLITGNIAPSIFMEKILRNNSLSKLILVKNNKSIDDADNIGWGFGSETRIFSQIRLTENLYDKIKNVATGKTRLFEFRDTEYEGTKLEVTIGDRPRIINLHNIENLSIIESIPKDIRLVDGYPDKKKLLSYFIKTADEYLNDFVCTIAKKQ